MSCVKSASLSRRTRHRGRHTMELAKAAILEKLARLYADAIILDKAIAADKVEADVDASSAGIQ